MQALSSPPGVSITPGAGPGAKGWDGIAAYRFPLGSRGTRGAVAASHHHYGLGRALARSGAQGQVDALGAAVDVPLTTTGNGRLSWQIGVELRRMGHAPNASKASTMSNASNASYARKAMAFTDSRRAVAVTTGLQAAMVPSAGSAAWGGVWMEVGDVRLRDAAAAVADAASARSAGEYLLLSSDLALLKQWNAWGLLLRGSGQIANKNLDASKKFPLGGAHGVRAWPLGEASGDHGVLAQMELRYRWKALEPFGFVDAGRVRFSHTPWETSARARVLPQGRTLAGAGVGLRWQHGPWSADGAAGWRLGTAMHRRSLSAPKARMPQLWVSVAYAL